MSNYKDLEEFGFEPETSSEKKEDIEDLSEFGFEPEIVEEVEQAEEDTMSPISSTLLGAGIGQAVKSGASVASPKVDTLMKGVKQFPIIGEFAKAAEYAEKGKGVVGRKQRQAILEESEELAKGLSDKLISQKKKGSKKMGKIINLVDKKLDPTNINQSLNQIEKSLSSIKAPTEEGQKSLDSIKNLLQDYKKVKSEYSVKSKGKVKTGIEEATDKLESIKSKLIMEAEQLGEERSFGPTKVIPEAKRVGALDIQKGKFISTPIKTGEFSPIEISKKDTSFFQKMSTNDLHSLERKIREVKDSTKSNTEVYKELINAENKVKEALSKRVEKVLGEQGTRIYKSGAKEYSDVYKAYDLLPELKKGEIGKVRTSDFLRKVGESNMAADSKKSILEKTLNKIKDDPEKLEDMKEAIYELSDRYGLSHLSTKYGIDTSMLRNLSVRAGDITGKVVKYPKKIASAIIKKAPWIGAIAGFGLTYSQARAEGRPVGEAIAEAAKEEGIDTLLGPFALMKPDQVGPKQGSIEYKLERGEQLSKEDLQELNERVKNNFKKTVENNPEKVDLNAIADSFDEIKQKPTSVSNQLRGIQKEQDPRRKKAKINFLMKTPGYRSLEKSIDNYMKSNIESFFGEDGQDNKEMQGVQNEEDTTNNTMPDTTSGIESKKKVENTREPSSVVENLYDNSNIKNLNKYEKALLQSKIGSNVDGLFGKNSKKAYNSYLEQNNKEPIQDTLTKNDLIGLPEPEELKEALEVLGNRESGNKYDEVNKYNYIGKYQFGAQALETLGYIKPGTWKKWTKKAKEQNVPIGKMDSFRNSNIFADNNNFTGKLGVNSKEDFLTNENAQETAVRENLVFNYNQFKKNNKKYGKKIDMDKLPEEDVLGLLFAAHLKGQEAKQFYKENIDSQDAYGTKTSDYFDLGQQEGIKNKLKSLIVPGQNGDIDLFPIITGQNVDADTPLYTQEDIKKEKSKIYKKKIGARNEQ